MNDYGYIKIKLDKVLEKTGISKNKVCHKAELERTQLNNYCKNITTRFDADVLARICYALDCKIEDILEYVPEKKEDK